MPTRKKERGVALLVALGVMLSMIGLCMGLFYIALADSKQANVNRGLIRATAYAEGATEVGHKAIIRAISLQGPVPTGGTAVIGDVNVPYTVSPMGGPRTSINAMGLQEVGQLYAIAATGEWNGIKKHIEKVIDVTRVPLFQFAIFYDKDLEIEPGPALKITGRVHTNGDMYLGAGATLTLDTNYVRAAGHVYRRDKTTGLPSDGVVNILISGSTKTAKMLTKKGFSAPSVSGFDSSFAGYDGNNDGDYLDKTDAKPWTEGALDLWNGTVKSIEQDYKPIAPPSVAIIDPYVELPGGTGGDYTLNTSTGGYDKVAAGTGDYQKGSYYANASMTIVDGKAYDANGVQITKWSTGGVENPADNPLSESSFYDAREGKYVTVTNVDMGLLAKSGNWPTNGLLYAMRTEASPTQPNGIRLKNGETFPAPLTVVSPDPVYVWGDYNKGNNTYPKQPAGIYTDALNVLSNAWDDTKTAGKLPHAKPTTVNCAYMTGAHPTTAGEYNGGFEGLPRFHEKWDGGPCTMDGSFVYVWESRIAKGKYAYGGDRWEALSRDWDYDKMFDDPTKLPPFTPSSYYTRRVAWLNR